MAEKPAPEQEPPVPEEESNRRFQETLGRLVNTPHKKHEPLKPKPKR